MSTIVTGVKPTGPPHLGNYVGMFRPTLMLAHEHAAYCFVADYHALNSGPDPEQLRDRTRAVAATLLSLGLDPQRSALYRQSDVPEVCELAYVLSCVTSKGQMNRAHAYKAAVDANRRAGRDPDAGVNVGLFTYPLLMAADILYPAADLVPVGPDQKQHLEITRAVAAAFNRRYGPVLAIPEPVITAATTVPGTDGRKMSKSHGNTIPVLAPPDELRSAVTGIVTDARPLGAAKDPETDTIFSLFQVVATAEQVSSMRDRYRAGGLGYADAKRELFEVLEETFRDPRRRFRDLLDDPGVVEDVLAEGARRVRERSRPVLEAVRSAVGTVSRRDLFQ